MVKIYSIQELSNFGDEISERFHLQQKWLASVKVMELKKSNEERANKENALSDIVGVVMSMRRPGSERVEKELSKETLSKMTSKYDWKNGL